MVKRAEHGREESDLDRIQDLFPGDHLRLHERDPLSPRKGLMRSKSSAASKIQKALPGKSKLANGEMPLCPSRPEALSYQRKQHLWGDDNFRVFIMESPVQFTMGVQKQDRHLFLFNDLLLVAKPRSGGSYKLKEKVRMCEMWLSQCLGDVCESIKSPATSFVIGWPTTNVVVTFSSLKTKDLWQQKLLQLIEESKEKEGKSQTSIQVSYRRPETGEEIHKTLKVDNKLTVQHCIKLLLQQLGYPESISKDFKLWVKSGKDESPYPLIGHEFPFNIKMNFIRELLKNSELDFRNLNNISTDVKCYFILRRNSFNSSTRIDPRLQKRKKHRRPHPKINWPFRRPTTSKHDSVDSGNGSPPPRTLFGLPLWKTCPDNGLPKPVMSMLVQLSVQGTDTVGIFRKSANARACRELKDKLEADPDYDLEGTPIVVVASVFKEFLRSLPDCLLQSDLYKSWLQAISFDSEWECNKRILSLLGRLPPPNVRLLQYLLCLLWNIAQNSAENKMSAMNLAVCVGPTLLNPGKFQSPILQQEDVTERVPRTVAFLIEHCAELFGDRVTRLLGTFPERGSSRQDSGAEESDSLVGQYRRDDSSIDSLDRDFLDEVEPCQSKTSLTNLSRDSGLTLSDTQLYAPEGGEEESTPPRHLAKSVPHLAKSAGGVSIDGSCHEVVRKRQAHRTRSSQHCCCCCCCPPPHLPLQMSYSHGMQRDLAGFVRNCHAPVRRRRPREVAETPQLRRSASEESLLQNYTAPSQRKRRAPSPPAPAQRGSARKTPDRHALWFAAHAARSSHWKRSQSASRIDDALSSEESTPQVSRSSSSSSKSHGDLVALCDAAPQQRSSSSSDGSSQSRPPSYLETLSRQTLLRQQQLQTPPSEEARAEQTSMSARARALYEDSVRIYAQQSSPGRRPAQSSPRADGVPARLRQLPPVHVTDAQLHRTRRQGLPEELRKEINWSVAELRAVFGGGEAPSRGRRSQQHSRSGEEESFV